MELLIFSDSHGNRSNMQWAYDRQPVRPRQIIFLGDGLRDLDAVYFEDQPICAVRGNCDWFGGDAREDATLELEGHRIFCTHGAVYNVKSGLERLKLAAAARNADIVLFGHTHRRHEEILPAGTVIGDHVLERPMYLFNPGSIGSGYGADCNSFGVLTLQGRSVLLSHGSIN